MPRYNNPKKTYRYSNDFKALAVELSHKPGVKVKDVAEGLDIHPFMLSRWRKEYREGKIKPDRRRRAALMKKDDIPTAAELKEMARLKRENERLKKENHLLKKWQRYLADQRKSGSGSSGDTDEP